LLKIGRYEIEAEIGRGAMGVVYLAHDPRLRRKVAVKAHNLPEGLSEEILQEYKERFLREAQAAAGLSHPGIVTVFDSDEDPDRGVPFIAMEYVEGNTLGRKLRSEDRLAPDEVVRIGIHLADALGTAHDAGIVHRDIKPANVLVRESDGDLKIADFGIARLGNSELTGTGTTLGSPAYMSPEQVRGLELDGRSDLFSLAVILHEALTGEKPFSGEDPVSLGYAIVHETPIPASRRSAGVSAGLDAFFSRALAKDPDDRFPDARSFADALGRALSEPAAADVEATVVEGKGCQDPLRQTTAFPPEEVPDTSSRRRWKPVAAAAAAIGLVLLLWAFFGGGGDAELLLHGTSSVEQGEVVLLVNGSTAYKRSLKVEAREQGRLRDLLDRPQESFEAVIEVDSGALEIVAEVREQGKGGVHTASLTINLEPGDSRDLTLLVAKRFGTQVTLRPGN
jgi:serine/threonine-protein kinase